MEGRQKYKKGRLWRRENVSKRLAQDSFILRFALATQFKNSDFHVSACFFESLTKECITASLMFVRAYK